MLQNLNFRKHLPFLMVNKNTYIDQTTWKIGSFTCNQSVSNRILYECRLCCAQAYNLHCTLFHSLLPYKSINILCVHRTSIYFYSEKKEAYVPFENWRIFQLTNLRKSESYTFTKNLISLTRFAPHFADIRY